MALHQQLLTYVFPSPFLPTGTRHLRPGERQRPPSFTVWQPHPCTHRSALSVRYSITCSSKGKNDANNSSSKNSKSSWSSFKPWFNKPKTSSDDSSTSSEPVGSVKSPIEKGPETDHTSPTMNEKITAASSDSRSGDLFVWPWQRERESQAHDVVKNKQDVSRPKRAPKITSPSTTQTGKKRVKHSDSKPGARLEVDKPLAPSEKEESLHDRWKRIYIDVIEPNLPRGKGPNETDVVQSKEVEVPTEESVKDVSRDYKKGSGIRELYKPPSKATSTDENPGEKDKGWFSLPWIRNGASENEIEEGTEQQDKSATNLSPKSEKADQAATPISSDSEEHSEEHNVYEKGWFTPPWKRSQKAHSEKSKSSSARSKLSNSESSSSDATKSQSSFGKRESPVGTSKRSDFRGSVSRDEPRAPSTTTTKKPWFTWPAKQGKGTNKTIADSTRAISEEQGKKRKSPKVPIEVVEKQKVRQEPGEKISDIEDGVKESEEIILETLRENGTREDGFQKKEAVVQKRSGKRNTSTETITIPQRDIANIRLIFGSETFFATETMTAPGGLIFRGNLRGEPKATLAKLDERLSARFGEKYTLCLAEGEEDRRPVVVVVPSAYHRRSVTPNQRLLATGVALLTASTCISRGIAANILRPSIFASYGVPSVNNIVDRLFFNPTISSVAVGCAIVVVIWLSQMAQRAVAAWHRTRIALPFILPSYQLGSFGAVVHLSSPTPTRAALFDIALAGVVALVVPSILCLIIGLRLSTSFTRVFPVPMSMVSGSILIGFLTKHVPHGKILVDYGRSLIGLHPLAIIGANCLTIAALNLLPIRQLDGGRIISALYGRKVALVASRVAVLFLLFASSKNPYLIMFLLAVSFGPWHVDRPSKNELTEPDGVRTIIGYLFMLLMIGLLLPYPKSAFFGTL